MDLYYINLDENGNSVGNPVNLGNKINTTQNELFPSYNDAENILFFSSDGHGGLGGMDVFAGKLNRQGQGTKSVNLGAPINSSKDDLSYVSNPLQTMGYFSSNREGGKGDDDIYGFSQKAPIKNSATVTGIAKDIVDGTVISDATFYIVNKKGEITDSVKTDKNGQYELSLNDVEEDFKVIGSKNGYNKMEQDMSFNSEKMEYNKDLNFIPKLDYYFAGLITDKATGAAISDVKISATDSKRDEFFEELKTGKEGSFKTTTLPYDYDDNINFTFKLEKAGYATRTLTVSEVLALKKEIAVGKDVNLTMDKIAVGNNFFDLYNLNPIFFDLNSSYLRKDAYVELDKIVAAMKENPRVSIELGSHTDQRESDKYNEWLSDRRAKSSVNYIVSKGISQDRITAKGYGESSPKKTQTQIDATPSEEAKEVMYQLNRRTEFIVVEMK
jgi:outer membrane protein OmpA-like peptidoglycan-associated protein